MAIEILTKNGSPFGTLYDKTGTTDEASEGQDADLSNTLSQVLNGKTPEEPQESKPDIVDTVSTAGSP